MARKFKKTVISGQDEEFFYAADRELIERFADAADVAKVDEAKRQIAEALGVVSKHVTVSVEMMFLLSV